MTTGGKALGYPLYSVVDSARPLPNFLIDNQNPYIWTIMVFSSAERAVNFAKHLMFVDGKLNLSFSVIQTEKEFRGILIALADLFTKIKWVHLDPSDSRRSPRRWEVKDLIDAGAKKG